ncbi:MAG: DUF2142 domain-containing protein [Caldilineaceae bacterium]
MTNLVPLPFGEATLHRLGWSGRRLEAAVVGSTLLIFLLMGFWYSLAVPPFEAPDEIHHYAFARHLSQGNGLPVQTRESAGPWEHEGTQAPLYYFLVGRLIAPIDQSDLAQISVLNPHANLGDPLFPGNKNRMLYSARQMPLVGANLAMHVGRWFSLLLSLVTLLCTYGIARLALPGSRVLPLLVLLTVASIPQFQFISATVSNDNLAIALSTATLYWLARLLVREVSSREWLSWLGLGVLVGLAALSKLHALGLLLLSVFVIGWLAWQRRDRWLLVRAGLLVVVPFLLIAGWWYWRNYTLYGEWLGVEQLLTINGLRVETRSLDDLLGELRGVRYSFWGLFGWFSILMPNFVYTGLDGVTLLVVSGVAVVVVGLWPRLRAALQQRHLQVQALLLLWVLMLTGLMFYWLTFATSGQGRLLFPAISGFGVLIVIGLGTWIRLAPPGWRLPLFLLLPAGLFASSLYALTVLLPASYHPSAPLTSVPPQATPYHVIYGTPQNDEIELLAVEVASGRFHPEDQVDVTLYLRAPRPVSRDYPLFVQLLGQEELVVGNVTTHPGWGRLPTTLWVPGEIYADRYRVPVWDNMSNRSPLMAKVFVGFVDPKSRLPLPIRTADNIPVDRAYVGQVSVVANQPLDPSIFLLRPDNADFAGQLQLIGFEYPQIATIGRDRQLSVTLLWEATAQPAKDYTAFVHLVDENERQVGGFDQPPAEGRFPTSAWQTGDRSLSRFPIEISPNLAPGRYTLWAGLYADDAGLERLPVVSSSLPIQDQRVMLGFVELR